MHTKVLEPLLIKADSMKKQRSAEDCSKFICQSEASVSTQAVTEADTEMDDMLTMPDFQFMQFARLICNPTKSLLENSLFKKDNKVLAALRLTKIVNA